MDQLTHHKTRWVIEKYADDRALARGEPFEVAEFEGNLLVNTGINEAMDLICGATATAFNNANAYIGVGDSSTAASASDTDLLGTNKTRKAQDATYPTSGTSQKATWKSTFGSADANYAWEEFGVFNASTGGVMLNRKVSSQGTKASGQTWVVSLEITLS